jgi:hypothetical protein
MSKDIARLVVALHPSSMLAAVNRHWSISVSLTILWRKAPNGAWEWAFHVQKGT